MTNNSDLRDLLFRALFSLIFLGLGFEHIFSDDLIQKLMPPWVTSPHLVSVLCGIWLLIWGACILVGWKMRVAAVALALFLVVVTIGVHLPGVLVTPTSVNGGCEEWWIILQRSNLAKNLCLLGVCCHFFDYKPGRYSIEQLREQSTIQDNT